MAILEVTNRTIKFRRRILNLRTVTSIEKQHGRAPRPFSTGSIALATFIGLLMLPFLVRAASLVPAFAVLAGCAGYVAYAVTINREPRDFWLLRIETAAGSRNLLASRDRHAIDEAVAAIAAALEADERTPNIVYNIDIADSTLVTDSIIEHSTIKNVGRATRRETV